MKLAELEEYKKRQRAAVRRSRLLLLALAAVSAALWFWAGGESSVQERKLMSSVREAQNFLYDLRVSRGSEFEKADDPYRTGFIGLEWSPLSTTLGALEAKRTACDPRWSVVVRRWMESLDVQPGDCVAVYSSSSFPGMAFNVLKALESLGARPLLVVSLGSSTWGANDPRFPWPTLEKELRAAGFLRTQAYAYTPGGGRDVGGGLPPEALELLRAAAAENRVPLVVKDSLEEVIQWKVDLLARHHAKALVSIGGSESNLGPGNDILRLRPGLHRSGSAGSGVIGRALQAGYPVAHLLNVKGLAAATGVPFDAPPGAIFHGARSLWASLACLAAFVAVMAVYKRWSF